MTRKHSRLAPSAAHRWMNCTGSVRLIESLPPSEQATGEQSEYAAEGTKAHALAEMMLGQPSLDPFQLNADTDMIEAVQVYVNEVRKWPGVLHIEKHMSLAALDPPEEMEGTADCVVTHERILRLFDLKYGVGVVVEVKDNEQLLTYLLMAALGELTRRVLGTSGDLDFEIEGAPLDAALNLFDEFHATVVQPRAPHSMGSVRSIEVTREELRDFAILLLQRARETQDANATLTPGNWCRFCPAQAHCPALSKHVQVVAQMDFEAVPVDTPPSPETLPLEVAAEVLTRVQVFENWFNALRGRIVRELEAGRDVPGWKLVNKRARRVWGDPTEVQAWASGSGLSPADYFEPLSLKSPAQMERVVGKKNLPDALVARVISGTTLVPSSDSRPAVAIGPAEEFAALPPAIPDAEIIAVEQGDDEQ